MTFLHLPADWVSRLSRYSIATKAKIRGHHKGSHRSARFGSSLDFSDFREYHPGDDVRHIDWNVYARTDRVYIKRFLDEQEMRVHLMIDSSKSMERKWLFTKQLAYTLGMMVLTKDDRLTVSGGQEKTVPFRKKGKSARKLFEHYMASLPGPTQNSFAGNAGFYVAKDSTVLFILSDGLEPIDDWVLFFKQTPRFSQDVRFLQISTAEERNPSFDGDMRLIDNETQEDVNVSMTQGALKAYQDKREAHNKALEAVCRKQGIQYMHVHAEDGIQQIVLQQLARRNWIE
ncbi:DUF58 domain-containing protein [Planococcus salinus]|uniref:DUF58 domain-containing protein n=1 Tax=Planococcus salinus TaxID=1848460 RepID=A0A3M8PAK8_9BACL|nr:DUF58 domain-containing protein [Planococcus salinus]RNF40746.1 DUF58 domain-containing protein [Planococcus salinus]